MNKNSRQRSLKMKLFLYIALVTTCISLLKLQVLLLIFSLIIKVFFYKNKIYNLKPFLTQWLCTILQFYWFVSKLLDEPVTLPGVKKYNKPLLSSVKRAKNITKIDWFAEVIILVDKNKRLEIISETSTSLAFDYIILRFRTRRGVW